MSTPRQKLQSFTVIFDDYRVNNVVGVKCDERTLASRVYEALRPYRDYEETEQECRDLWNDVIGVSK